MSDAVEKQTIPLVEVTIDDEVGDEFQGMALSEVSAQTLVDWMQDYFG